MKKNIVDMRGVQNIYHHSYTISLLYIVVMILLCPAFSINANILSSTESLTISSNRTIVSPGDVFELGFFKPGTSPRWYLGIWYKTIHQGTSVWVANRDRPLFNSVGTLKISDCNLIILDQSGTLIWSTNLTRGDGRSPLVAELLANGNFVLRYSNNNDPSRFLWQSFHFPTDTLLPQMKIGWDGKTKLNRVLKSWRSPDDPSTGEYLYKLRTRSPPEFILWQVDVPFYRSGPWNGIRFSGMPEMRELDYMVYNLTENGEEITYTFLMKNHSTYSSLTVTPTGILQQFTWISEEQDRNIFWASPNDLCDGYTLCGPYGYCDTATLLCNCIRGFKPKILEAWALGNWASGCVRKTRLNCKGGDGFLPLKNMKLPETTSAVVDRRIGVKECKQRCLRNCNCTAFANADIRNSESGCVMWIGELLDIRNFPTTGQDLYVRLAAVDLEKKRNIKEKIIGLTIGIIVLLLLSFITIFYFWRRKQNQPNTIPTSIVHQDRNQDLLRNGMVISNRRHYSGELNNADHLELPLMAFETVIMATENFSDTNKLGQGGFGVVYKGKLLDGQEIAVKRLSEMSHQGTTEFMNEVKLIAKLQHINLVRLLGCCIDADEKMLIYEYLENLSLDSYLFDKTKSSELNWQKRFDVTNGIARGLLYLHQDSRCRIIHRDLKASNILLDKDMTPKISDFGMARIFARDETESITRKVVGTYGYMSPEYAMDGIFSVKSDVFSFGVLLLEIVSGKRNRGFHNYNYDSNLLGYTWRNWKEGNWLEIIDPVIRNSSSPLSSFRPQEALRCIQIGLLCVQELAEHRPTMSSVIMMLGSETAAIPPPKTPGYCVGRSPPETDTSSREQLDEDSCTMNQITMSKIDAR